MEVKNPNPFHFSPLYIIELLVSSSLLSFNPVPVLCVDLQCLQISVKGTREWKCYKESCEWYSKISCKIPFCTVIGQLLFPSNLGGQEFFNQPSSYFFVDNAVHFNSVPYL